MYRVPFVVGVAVKYYLVSLGCPKNTVDAEDMALLLNAASHVQVDDPAQADLLLVNTCGFIERARAESMQVLNDLAHRKRPAQRLVATGCLSQRDGAALARQVPGLDGILGTRRWAEVVSLVDQLDRRRPLRRMRSGATAAVALVGDSPVPTPRSAVSRPVPRVALQGSSGYLMIADGCSAPCAFCAIPLIKGPLCSRPMEDVLADARYLAEQGMREIILIAQDTTAYGRDVGQPDALPDLLDALMAVVPQVPWVRLMYAYPQHVSQQLIETMAREDQIVHYLDLPLQHAHPATLRRMGRPSDIDRVCHLVDDLRRAMPDIALRTSFIVGYPGETEVEFRALEQFVQEVQFDKVGVFTYSPEEGTRAIDLPGHVPQEVKQERFDRLMSRQQAISLARNQAQVGRTLAVLVEGQGEVKPEESAVPPDAREAGEEGAISVGRCYRDAPEIDGMVLIEEPLEPGRMVQVQITGAMEYDLVGAVVGQRDA